MKYFLLTVSTLGLISPALAQTSEINCTPAPDCASLGYTESSCPDGAGLKCPFGNKWFCAEEKTPECQPKDCSDYPLRLEQITIGSGTYKQCVPGCGDNTPRYKFVSCNDGYYESSGKCIENSCNNYPYISKPSSIDHCLTIGSCKRGNTTVYGCTKCEDGYGDKNGHSASFEGNCPQIQCSDYCYITEGGFSLDSFNQLTRPTNCGYYGYLSCFKGQTLYYRCATLYGCGF